MSCYNGSQRYRDTWTNEADLKKIKSRRYKSARPVLKWLPFRKELNLLGFDDAMIKTAIISKFGIYNSKKDKETLKTKGGFEKVFGHWFSKIIIQSRNIEPTKDMEQVSGIFSETQKVITHKRCSEIHKWELVDNLIEYRIQDSSHVGSFLMDLLETKFKGFSKFVRNNPHQEGLGTFYGGYNAENLSDYEISFRTKKGEIELNFLDLVNGKIPTDQRHQEIKDFVEWNKNQYCMNDTELKAWILERGIITYYNKDGKKVKESIPTVKEERAEWEKSIEQIRNKYSSQKFNKMLNLVRGEDLLK